jgi:chorismate mutase
MKTLDDLRNDINHIDNELIKLLASRFNVCADIAEYKKLHGIPMMQSDRVKEVVNRCVLLGNKYDINSDIIVKIYKIIIDHACDLEENIILKI